MWLVTWMKTESIPVKFADETKLEGTVHVTSRLRALSSSHPLALPSPTRDCRVCIKTCWPCSLERVWPACPGIGFATWERGPSLASFSSVHIFLSFFIVLSGLFPLSTHLLATSLRLRFTSYSAQETAVIQKLEIQWWTRPTSPLQDKQMVNT